MSAPAAVADPWQVRIERMRRVLPLPLLVLSTVAALLVRDTLAPGWARQWVGIPGALLAAVLWTVLTARPQLWQRPPVRAALFVAQTVLAALLVWVSRAYGVFAYVGFLYAYGLGRRARIAGFVATALVVAAAMSDGYPLTGGQVGTYLFVAVVMVALVMNSASITTRALAQNQERGRVIAELAEANRLLEASMAENAQLHDQLVERARETGVAEERRRLAGEIHDTLAQGLAGIVTQLQAAELQIDRAPPAESGSRSGELRRHLEQAATLAREGLTEARRSVRALRPEQLEQASLPEALTDLVDGWGRRTGVAAAFRVEGDTADVSDEIEDVLFRVAQEALTNVARHAAATKVTVTLTGLDGVLLLDIVDDGAGFDVSVPPAGFGLSGMQHRLARIGGRLTVDSRPDGGTAVNATASSGSASPHSSPSTQESA